MKEKKELFHALEEFDKTGKFALDKIRRSYTLKRSTVEKLRRLAKERCIKMSNVIDGLVEEII
jgi:hypothetical protein